MLGGLFILVDYYLTAALSALSGALYLAVVVTIEDQGMLPPMAVDRIRRHTAGGMTVLHMYTSKVRPLPEPVTA
jgi:hypothetical protein